MNIARNIKILSLFNFFNDFILFSPVAILYFAEVTGSYAKGISIFSLAMLFSAIFEVPTGVFSDFVGRKKAMIIGAVAYVFCFTFYAIGMSFWFLAIGAMFEGLARSFFSGNNDALLHDTVTELGKEEEYAHIYGRVSAMNQAALAASAILGGLLAFISFKLVVWLSVVPQLICVFLAFQIISPKSYLKESANIYNHLKDALRLFFTNYKLRNLSLTNILGFGMGEASFTFQSAFFATVWPVWAIGIAKTISYAGAAVTYYFGGKIVKRFGELQVILFGTLLNRFANIIAMAFPTIVSPALMGSTSVVYGAVQVARNSMLQKEFTKEQRATMGSLNSFGGSIFYAIFAFLIGFVADNIGPAKTLLIVQFLQFIPVWINWQLFRRERRIQA